jgi:recombination protein RecR
VAVMSYPPLIKRLIKDLQRLPGIGVKTAERLVFHMLNAPAEEVLSLAESIRMIKEKVKKCSYCFNITDDDPCVICRDPKRDSSIICVVEQPKDLIAIEKTGHYQGVYHVLLGRLAPLDNQHPENLTIEALVKRIKERKDTNNPVKEVIIATNPDLEGDTTALYLVNALQEYSLKISRIARGIPSGSSIEFANQAILTDAITERKLIVKEISKF